MAVFSSNEAQCCQYAIIGFFSVDFICGSTQTLPSKGPSTKSASVYGEADNA